MVTKTILNCAPATLGPDTVFPVVDAELPAAERNARTTLLEIATAAALIAPAPFNTISGDPLTNTALADIIKHTPSDMVFNASRWGVNTTDTPEQQSTALEVLEAAAYTLATTGGRGRAVIILDRKFTIVRPFTCRDRVVPIAPLRSGFGFQPASNFVGQALAVSVVAEQYFYVGLVQPWTNIEFDGLRLGVFRGDSDIIKNAPGMTGATFSNGFVPQIGDLVENDGLDFPTFMSTVTPTGGGLYDIGFTSNAAWDNTNAGDPTLNKRRLQIKRGTTGNLTRTCTATTTTRTLPVSSTTGLVVGMRLASTKLGDNTRIVSIGSGEIVINKVPTQNGTGPLFAWTELEGLVAEFAEVTLPDWDDNNKTCRISTDNCHMHDLAGNGLTVRGNRTGAHIWETRTTSCFGHGMELTSSDAYVIRAESGENFRHNLVWQGATPRGNGEFYSNNNSLWASVKMGGDDKLTLYDSEVTGRIEGNGTSSPESVVPAFNLLMLNQRMGKGNIHPDPTFPMCLMHGRSNMRFISRMGTIVSEIPIRYVWYSEPGSTATCDIGDVVFEVNAGQPATLFSTALTNSPLTLTLSGVVSPSTGRRTTSHPLGQDITSTGGSIVIGASGGVELTDSITLGGQVKYSLGLSIDFPSLTSAVAYNIPARQVKTCVRNGSILASAIFNLPAAPAAGVPFYEIVTAAGATALTVTAAGGATVAGAPASLTPGQRIAFAYRASATTWYPA